MICHHVLPFMIRNKGKSTQKVRYVVAQKTIFLVVLFMLQYNNKT